MFRIVVLLSVVTFFNAFTHAQETKTLKSQCEKIIIESITEAARNRPDARTLFRSRLVPGDDVTKVLVKGLAANDSEIRLAAASVLSEKAPDEFRDRIRRSLNELKLQNSTDRVRRAVLLMNLGDEQANQEVSHWANTNLKNWIWATGFVQ